MSKSLKNFMSIDDALNNISTYQLRWMFIMHKWVDDMNFSENTILNAKVYDVMVANFFDHIINYSFDINYINYDDREYSLDEYFTEIEENIITELHEFNFDKAYIILQKLINKLNQYEFNQKK